MADETAAPVVQVSAPAPLDSAGNPRVHNVTVECIRTAGDHVYGFGCIGIYFQKDNPLTFDVSDPELAELQKCPVYLSVTVN
jgi:hypothetical protein